MTQKISKVLGAVNLKERGGLELQIPILVGSNANELPNTPVKATERGVRKTNLEK